MRINWLQAKYYFYDGYGRFGTKLMRACVQQGLNITPMLTDQVWDMPGWMQRLAGADYTHLSLSVSPPHVIPYAPGRVWGLTMTEAYGMPDGWVDALNGRTERVIVPANWLKDLFTEEKVFRPITVIPGGVDAVEFPQLTNPGWEHRPYTFLSLGDRGRRKGHDLVWRAFCQAFTEKDDVRLIQKMRDPRQVGGSYIDNTASPDNMVRKVAIWGEDVQSMADVFPQVDCFVFPSRGEGWGMPPREAACMGVPTIVTRWGGLLEGIDGWATRTVDTFTEEDAPPKANALKGRWVVPDVDEIAAHMRWCYENRDEAWQKAAEGAQWLRANMTWDIAARQLLDMLERYN